MAAQTEDKKLDGAGLSVLWGLIKNIIPTVPTNVSSFTNDAAYVSQLETHNQNLVLASPNGASGLPSFRALAASDIPDLSGTYLTSASLNGYATQSWVTSQGFGTVSSIKVGTTSYSPSSGVVSLPAYPTTLPASDVYSWAKQSSKPSYSYSEISGTPSSLPASDVYSWAKASSKPSYSWSEIGSRPTKLSEFTNDSGFITGITSSMVTTALGFTPANSTSLSSYLPLTGATINSAFKLNTTTTGWMAWFESTGTRVVMCNYDTTALSARCVKNDTTAIFTCIGNMGTLSGSGNTRFTVLSNGNVGIGVDTPDRALSIQSERDYPVMIKSVATSNTPTVKNDLYLIMNTDKLSAANYAGSGVRMSIGLGASKCGILQWVGTSEWGNQGRFSFINKKSDGTEYESICIPPNGNVGISTTSPSYKLHVAGAVGATAFTNTSDIRNKDFISDTSMSIEQIANAPSFLFKWKTGDDRNVHAGSSAQYWNMVLPETVSAANDEQHTLSMQYDVIALLSAITIAKEVVNDKERIRQLEQRVSQLEAQLAN